MDQSSLTMMIPKTSSSSSSRAVMMLTSFCFLVRLTSIDSFSFTLSPFTSSSQMRQNKYLDSGSGSGSSFHIHSYKNQPTTKTQLFFFRKLFGNNEKEKEDTKKNEEEGAEKNNPNETKTPFFSNEVVKSNTSSAPPSIEKQEEEEAAAVVVVTKPKVPVPLSPMEQAQLLRKQAERARLEAEKMDVMLTIQKLEKLELELEKINQSKNKSNNNNDNNERSSSAATNTKPPSEKQLEEKKQDVMTQITVLKKKLNNGDQEEDKRNASSTSRSSDTNGDQDKTTVITTKETEKKNVDDVILSIIEEAKKSPQSSTVNSFSSSSSSAEPHSKEIEDRVQKFDDAPTFMKELIVNAAGMKMENLNSTELILKMYRDDIEYNNNMKDETSAAAVPNFTQEQIDEVVEAVKLVPQFVKSLYGDEIKNNDTAIALLMLEEEWKEGKIVEMPEITQQMIDDKLVEVKWVPQFLRGDNETELALELIKMDFKNNPKEFRARVLGGDEESTTVIADSAKDDSTKKVVISAQSLFGGLTSEQEERSDNDKMIESLFPKSTRREGEEPSEKDLSVLLVDVFAKDKTWSASGRPEKVPGGYIIRGVTKYDTGKELMENIKTKLTKSNLDDKLSVFYLFDPTVVTEDQMEGGERPPVLFVTGPKVVRDTEPIQRSIVSSFALATLWYNAVFPYLLNEKYAKLVDEQLALADASMPANLDFLNDLSFPLFAAAIGIQVAHEVAHLVVAKANNFEIAFPTLVPSLASGLTGAITSLQSAPKDKQALFDFAIAGPLVGIAASIVLMYTGLFVSSSMDPSSFSDLPALPLGLLRQSSLGGGIIESISPGLLTVPDAALGTKALSDINIALHPYTIAGYLGLMINAVNLLPVGRTDGGRISLALFGRSGTQLVSLIALIGLFVGGVMGSDLLLFFFSFLVFFQSEPEVPQENEVDDMDFSRVLLATATGCLVLLTLIPM